MLHSAYSSLAAYPEKVARLKNQHYIGEVEDIFGIPRSKIQFYLKKSLLDVERNEDNGYHLFTQQDLLQLKHLLIARNAVGFSLEESRSRVNLEELSDLQHLFKKQEQALHERIKKDQRSLEVIAIFNRMLKRIEHYEGRIEVLEVSPLHVFPESFVYDMRKSVIDVGYVSSCFNLCDGEPVFEGLCSIVHDKDLFLISKTDLEERTSVLPAQRYLFSVVKTHEPMDSTGFLQALLDWANEHEYTLGSPFYVSYLFEMDGDDGSTQYYHEVYLPLKAA